MVRNDEPLGQEVVAKGVGGRGGRERQDALLSIAEEEMNGQAPALAGGGSGCGFTRELGVEDYRIRIEL